MNFKYYFFLIFISFQLHAQNNNKSIGFIENKGQIIDQKGRANTAVKYLLNTNGLNVQLRKNGFSYDVYEVKKHPLTKRELERQHSFSDLHDEKDKAPEYSLEYIYHRIDIDFKNSNSNVELIAEEKSTDYDNYYNIPNKPEGVLYVHKFQLITYKNIYPNIDVVFFIPEDKSKPVEYNFVIHTKGKISDIQMKFNGAKTDLVNNKIKISTRFGEMEETLPLSWVEDGNDKNEIAIGYTKIKKDVYGFKTNENLIGKKVVIDPVPVLLWGTYYGGDGIESPNSIETDVNDNVYISGLTNSSENIATSGTYQSEFINGGIYNTTNLFFVKFDSNGKRIWGTYFYYWNSSYYFPGAKIKTDTKSNLYFGVEENISTNIATTGSYQKIKNNGYDGVLVKLNKLGVREWATYYGGNGDDIIKSICIDHIDNVYIAGVTSSNDALSSQDSYQSQNNSELEKQEAFIAKFDSQGNRLWGTFYGGTDYDTFYYIDISIDNFLYATGTQNSNNYISNFNESAGMPLTTMPVKATAVVVKFDLNGKLIWQNSIFDDSVIYNAKLKGDIIYLVGETWNKTAIATNGTFYENYQNTVPTNSHLPLSKYKTSNSFVVSFNTQTQQKNWGTYFIEIIKGIDVNQKNQIYISGETSILNDIATPCSYKSNISFNTQCYLIKLNSSGQRSWGTYIGGNFNEIHGLVKIDNKQDVYLYGNTFGSTTGIATPGSYQTIFKQTPINNNDTFLQKFQDDDSLSNLSVISNSPICIGKTLELKASGGTNYAWTGPNGYTSTDQNPIILNASNLNSGQYSCAITGTGGCDNTITIDVVVGDTIAPIPDLTTLPNITGDCNITISTIPTATDNCAGTIQGTTLNPLFYDLAGTYTIVWNYDDGNGNSITQNQTVVLTSYKITSYGSIQTGCKTEVQLGEITIDTPASEYSFDDGLTWSTNPKLTNFEENTQYCLRIKNNLGCISEKSCFTTIVQIPIPSAPSISTKQPIDCTSNTGIITVTTTKAEYSFDDGLTWTKNPVSPPLKSGTYLVRTKEKNSECISYATTAIINAPPETPNTPLTEITQPTSCSNPFGSIKITSTASLYSFDNGITYSSNPNSELLPVGTYAAKVKNNSGCESEPAIVNIIKPNDYPNIPTISIIQPDCSNPSGTISVTSPSSEYSFDNGANWTTVSILGNLTPGNYSVLVKNDKGCISETATAVLIPFSNFPSKPTSSSPETFCIYQNTTINNITIQGQNIQWYDSLTEGNALPITTSLQNGITYYASQTINGCESLRVPVVVNIQNTTIPTGISEQTLCANGNTTLNDIVVSGTDIIWYNELIDGTVLPSNTALQTNTTYYCSQTINGCESLRNSFSIQLINTLNANDHAESFCDDLNNGFEIIDLRNYNADLISNPENFTFEYYNSMNGANNQIGSDKVNRVENYSLQIGINTIYVRIDSANGCHQVVTLNFSLFSKPILNISDIVPICENKSITINAGNGFDSYLWSTGATSSNIYISQAGNYNVTVTQNHGNLICSTTKEFLVVMSNIATITNIDIQDWTDDKNVIVVNTRGFGDYEYSIDGIRFQNSNTFTDVLSGNYTVYVRDKNGCGIVKEDVFLLMYAKFFTPNGDGYNDNWNIKYSNHEEGLTVKIFDRYGKFIKNLDYNDKGWDGTLNGKNLPSTDYWFVATRANGKEFRGHFSLKR